MEAILLHFLFVGRKRAGAGGTDCQHHWSSGVFTAQLMISLKSINYFICMHGLRQRCSSVRQPIKIPTVMSQGVLIAPEALSQTTVVLTSPYFSSNIASA